jgi:antitoxin (DNA-binding transcriptional repressor) of toxin-antitoxin stability system
MDVLEISSREFKNRQTEVFDCVDRGYNVIIKRGNKRSYKISPIEIDDDIDNDDAYFTPEMMKKIDLAMKEAAEGKVTRVTSLEELKAHLEAL